MVTGDKPLKTFSPPEITHIEKIPPEVSPVRSVRVTTPPHGSDRVRSTG